MEQDEELLNQHEAEHLNAEGNQLMQQKQFQLGEQHIFLSFRFVSTFCT